MSLDPSPEKKAKLQRVELPRVRDEVVWARKVDDELKKMDILNSLEDEKKLKEEFIKLPRLLTPKYDMQLTRFRFTTADPQWPLLPLMLRSGMAQLVREIKARLADPSEKSVYVTGHQGCGKSFALYAAVCFFRRGRAKYRVTYIPDCGEWLIKPWDYLYGALAATFYDDEVETREGGKKTIVELLEEMAMRVQVTMNQPFETTRQETVKELFEVLERYAKSKNLQWIFVMDQQNRIRSQNKTGEYPFSLSENFGFPQKRLRVVSASANNQIADSYHKPFKFGTRTPQYTQTEFKLVMDDAKIINDQQRLEIEVATNRIPFYVSEVLNRLHDQKKTLKQALKDFEICMTESFQETNMNFRKNPNIDLDCFFLSATHMILCLPFESIGHIHFGSCDRQLTMIREDSKTKKLFLEPVIPCALRVIQSMLETRRNFESSNEPVK